MPPDSLGQEFGQDMAKAALCSAMFRVSADSQKEDRFIEDMKVGSELRVEVVHISFLLVTDAGWLLGPWLGLLVGTAAWVLCLASSQHSDWLLRMSIPQSETRGRCIALYHLALKVT